MSNPNVNEANARVAEARRNARRDALIEQIARANASMLRTVAAANPTNVPVGGSKRDPINGIG
jgi:hypothetical protein